MPGLSKVIVLDPDVRAGRQMKLGFEREGVPAAAMLADPAKLDLVREDTGLVVVGGVGASGLELLRRARAQLTERRIDAAIVFAGRGVERGDARVAGADETMLPPVYLRDVVTIGRVLRDVPATGRAHLVGTLGEITGVYNLVRAFAALARSATLTLIRGLRRGEIRFWHGEVTSAQVGMIHGQAALHQLLLWTDARFDFHHEDVVRRQQIPLTHDELFADAERFLEGVCDSSGGLSPSVVLDQDLPRVQSFGKQIPTEVYGVLRMFDGHRVLADVLEDSAYRVFETLRVAQRAVEIGLLRVIDPQPARPTWRTVLAIEEWLVGGDGRELAIDSGPVMAASAGRDARSRSRKKRRKKKRATTPVAVPVAGATKEIDWGALVPRIVGAEVGPLAGVVPAAQASGEIAPRPSAGMERLPAVEPKVVFDEARERARNAAEIAARAERIRVAAARGSQASTVTAASEPAHVAGERAADDTKPERVGNRTTMQGVAVVAQAVTAAPVVDVSGAITVPVAVPDAAVVAVSGAVTTKVAVPPPPTVPAPGVIIDEPSDGVIVQHIATAHTTPVKRRRLPSDPPEDDRPDDAMGEITAPRTRTSDEPRDNEPSILVADLAAVHGAVSVIAVAQAAAPPTADATSAVHEAPVIAARRDAAAFSEVEEAFFRAGQTKDVAAPPPVVESFDDLDAGYQPLGFWARLRGKTRKQASGKVARPATLDWPATLDTPAVAKPATLGRPSADKPAADKPAVRANKPTLAKLPVTGKPPVSTKTPARGKPKRR